MSAQATASHDHATAHGSGHGDHGHGDHGDHGGHGGHEMHVSMKGYMTGFVLSVILTAIPFWLVMTGYLGSRQATALTIMGFAVVQIVVHMIFFLHMDARAEGGWTMMALLFTLTLVAIALIGSLWVMYHLNVNMMPGMMPEPPMGVPPGAEGAMQGLQGSSP